MEQHMPAILNKDRQQLPGPRLLHEFILQPTADSLAIDFLHSDNSRTSLSYDKLWSASSLLAHQIRQLLSVTNGKQQIIPVIIPQCPELYIAWTAVLQAGACFCPVQPDAPPERLKFIVQDCCADLILCLEEQASRTSSTIPGAKCLSFSLRALQSASTDRQPRWEAGPTTPNVEPSDLAYVMYTSGSTGLPKGVKMSHLSVTQSLLAHEQHIPAFKRFLQFAAPTFDVAIFEVFFPFLRGATLVGCTRERLLTDLPGVIVTLDADAAELTPTVAGTLLRTRDAAPCLSLLLTIGEMLTKSVIEQFGCCGTRKGILFAMYGPTEAAIHCTIASRLPASSSVRNIGKPLSTVTTFILKDSASKKPLEIALRGEPGELAVAGQLADGYLNRPEQNEAAFVELPEYGQIYRTGDRATCLPDGSLEIIGRMSAGQVKLRGQRVELGEIEEVASRTSGLTMAVAVIVNDALVLFCESHALTPPSDVQATCKAWLPPFMRPSLVIMLEEGFPRLPSGKIDRKKLESGYLSSGVAQAAESQDSFASEAESILVSTFGSGLGRRISRDTDLWSCGLDSLRAIKIAARLRAYFPGVGMKTLLQCSTVAELALQLSIPPDFREGLPDLQLNNSDEWSAIERNTRDRLQSMHLSAQKILPCSPTQTAMLTETTMKAELNFNTIKLRTLPAVSDFDLWSALCKLAKGNEILRSGFIFTDYAAVPFAQVVWHCLDRHSLNLMYPLQLFSEQRDGGADMSLHIHHALYDGWSWELMLDDLNDILEDKPPPIRPQFDLLASHQGRIACASSQDDLEYWTFLLKDRATELLPTLTYENGSLEAREGFTQNLGLSYARLSVLTAGLRVARQSILQACWALLLSAYTDSSDVLFGTVASGRHLTVEGVDQIIGPCLLTLPYRVDLSSLRSVRDLILFNQRQWLESLSHSNVALRDIFRGLDGGKGQRPFETLFVWQEGYSSSSDRRQHVETEATEDVLEYTAVLEVEPTRDILRAKLTVNKQRVPAPQARMLLHQLDALLSHLVDSLDTDLRDVWHHGPEIVMSISNANYTSLETDSDLAGVIRQTSETAPSRLAVKFVKDFDPATGKTVVQSLSYGELYGQAGCIAANLADSYDVKPDQLVGIIAEKSLQLYVVILGVVMSGAGYLCIDPSTPAARVDSILEQAGCVVILTGESLQNSTLDTPSPVVPFRRILEVSNVVPKLTSKASADHLAYAVFTSGTTGVPKGVLITRRNLLSNIDCLSKMYPCSPETDSLLQACSPAFDVSAFEIFWTWFMGMTLCSVSNDVLFRDTEGLIHEMGITHLSMTPSVAALVNPSRVLKVKMLVTAGEPMNSTVFRLWGGHGLFQGYGPSETTNICNVRPYVDVTDHENNVGPAVPNTSIFICSQHPRTAASALSVDDFRLLPRGAVGEVWIGGDQVGRGYVDEALTSQSFLDHPRYGRLYRSGDIGRLLLDDSLVILGRTDDQAKVRGQRIELGEINHTLLDNTFVRDAVSFIDDGDGNSRLLCFLILHNDPELPSVPSLIKQLFDRLEDSLPSYMVPDAMLPVSKIPLTKQGKVDKRDLLQQYRKLSPEQTAGFSRQHTEELDEDPLNEVQLRLAEALAEAIDIPLNTIRASSSFYTLGLDSISAIRLSQSFVRHDLPRADVSSILKYPSIKLLSPVLTRKRDSQAQQTQQQRAASAALFEQDWLQDVQSRIAASGARVQEVLPCTDLQLAMLSKYEGQNSKAYQNTMRFAVKCDLRQLKRAWDLAVRRHDLVRAIFVNCPSSAMPYAQVILASKEFEWRAEAKEIAYSNINGDPSINPLRLTVTAPEGRVAELHLEIHHALYDAEAISNLLLEIQDSYYGLDLPLAPSFQRYLDYAAAIETEAQEAFWNDQLQGAAPCRLTDRLRRESSASQRGMQVASLSCSVTLGDLESSAKRQQVSCLSVLQCALARLMFYFLNRQDVCFGNVYSGRTLPIEGVQRIFGPCFNTLPVRVRAKRNISITQLTNTLQKTNAQMLSMQTSSLRRIQRLNSPVGSQLFDVLLLLQQPQPELDHDIWELLEDSGDMSFPFIFEVYQDSRQNQVRTTLHSEVVTDETLKHILEFFDSMLRHSVLYPQAPATNFSWMSADIVNRLSSLRSPDLAHASQQAHAEPLKDESWSAVEAAVRDTLIDLSPFELPKVSKQTTLFQLGLDSINAVQAAARLRSLGYVVFSSDIMNGPRIAEISRSCTQTKPHPAREEYDFAAFDLRLRPALCQREDLRTSMIEAIRPCTPTQSGILAQYLKSNGQLYLNTLSLKLADDIDISRLRESWLVIMQRHEMLRTGFTECDGEAYPFLMLTYHPHAVVLPWYEDGLNSDRSEGIEQAGIDYEQLAKPPWFLRLSSCDGICYLEIAMLHALYDARSMDIILADVARWYFGAALPEAVPISPTLSAILTQSESPEARQAWVDKVNSIQPTKFPDLNIYTEQKKTSSVISKRALMSFSDIKNRLAELGCSLQAVCQASWATLLAAYTGQNRVTFGLTLSGRTFDDTRNDAAFPCINTLPCSINLGETSDLLTQISQISSKISPHQQTPLTSVKRWQNVEAEAFDTILVLQSSNSVQHEHVPWTVLEDRLSAEYPVSLEVLPDAQRDEIVFRATYSEQLIPREAAKQMLEYFSSHINGMLQLFPSPILPHLSDSLSAVPPKQERLPSHTHFLHEMLERSAERTPNATALEFVTNLEGIETMMDSWSYKQLDEEGNCVAHLLLQQGAKTGDMVAICFDKCPQGSFAILGVLKAGCAYVAIDPGAPIDRKKFILEDASCKVVLTTIDRLSDFEKSDDVVVLPLDDPGVAEYLPRTKPWLAVALKPQDTCYCLYTSGTTGTPKGCLISHDSAIQAMLSFERIFQGHWTSESRWLQFASFHFDVSVLEQYWSWYIGMRVTSAPRDLIFEDIPGFIQKLKITHLDLTPSLARLLTPADMPSLCDGVFIVGGEQVSQDIIETWGDAGCLYNFYGPSEVTIGCTVQPRVTKHTKATNIGQQWDNVGTFVLEPGTENAVIRGAVGELCLSGVLVGKGYLNRPDLTAKSFVTLGRSGTRVYRTGDLVRLLYDDSFQFLGRIDDQVKLRGQRLEIGEINMVIRKYRTDVKDVATVVAKHPTQGKEQLVAFFSTAETKSHEGLCNLVKTPMAMSLATQLRRCCIEKLPGYMIPAVFLMVTGIPLTMNNKVDKRKLLQLYKDWFDSADSHGENDTQFEENQEFRVLAGILEEFFRLPTETIKPDSRLFELGLDSISAIGLARALRKAGFAGSHVTSLLRNSTVTDLVEALVSSRSDDGGFKDAVDASKRMISAFAEDHRDTIFKMLGIGPAAVESIAPCTPLQEGMISKVTRDELNDSVYFAQFHYDLRDHVNPRKLRECWMLIQQTTSILRTYFVPTTDGVAQVVLKRPMLASEIREENVAWSKTSFQTWTKSARSFGLSLPWQVIMSPGWGNTYMTLFIFHGLYDGISLDLLLGKLIETYISSRQESPVSNFYNILASGPLRRQPGAKDFWQTRLPFVQKIDALAKYRPRASLDPVRRPSKKTLILTDVDALCSSLSITRPALFQAAWLVTLHRSFDVNASIGIVLSGRSIPNEDAETAIGPLFNTVPLAVEGLPAEADLTGLAKACYDFNVEVLPYQHTALRHIAKWLDQDPRDELFDSLFVYQREQKPSTKHQLWRATASDSAPDYPLNLEVEQKIDGSFALTLAAKQEYFSRADEEHLLSTLAEIIEGAVKGEKIALPDAFRKRSHGTNRKGVRNRVKAAAWDEGELRKILSSVEETIARLVADLAGSDRGEIGLTRPTIFELGLDSIDVMRLAARLWDAGLRAPVSKIMQAPTVAGIANTIEHTEARARMGKQAQQVDPSLENIETKQPRYRELLSAQGVQLNGVQRILPVTPMQEGLLIDFEKYYNVQVYQLEEWVDPEVLRQAWTQVVECEPILRTTFVVPEDAQSDDSFLQLVHGPEYSVAILLDDIAYVNTISEAASDFRSLFTEHGISTPTVRLRLVQTCAQRYMLLGMPHAAYDAWSTKLLHQEIARAYINHGSGQPSAAIPYEYHVEMATQQASSEDGISFWRATLQSLQPTIFASDTTSNSNCESQYLYRDTSIRLSTGMNFCKEQGVTLQSLALACWSLTLSQHARARDVCFGLVVSGRTTEGAGSLIFPTLNTVLFRSQLDPRRTRADFLREVHDLSVRISEHQHFPLREAVKLAKGHDNRQAELFDTLFTYQKTPDIGGGAQQLYREIDVTGGPLNPPYAINVEMEGRDDGLWWTIATQEGVLNKLGVQALFETIDHVLKAIIEQPDSPVLSFEDGKASICSLAPVQFQSALTDAHSGNQQSEGTASGDWTEAETAIRQVFAEISKTDVDKIGKNTGIFNLGLDSISAIKVAGLLKKRGLKVAVSQIIEAHTVKKIAMATQRVEEERVEPAHLTLRSANDSISRYAETLRRAKLVLEDVESIIPATAGQTYMLDLWTKTGGRMAYPTFWLVVENVTAEELSQAMSRLAERIPLLRTTFIRTDRAWGSEVVQVALARQAAQRYPLSWKYSIQPEGVKLLVTLKLHHALYDAVSFQIMLDELQRLCSGIEMAGTELNTEYGHFVGLTKELDSSLKIQQKDFWGRYLSSTSESLFHHANVKRGSFDAPRLERFNPQLLRVANLENLLQEEGVSIQALFFAVCGKMYARLGSAPGYDQTRTHVVLGIYLANRSLDVVDLANLAAPTFNVVPLKINVSDDLNLFEAAKDVQSNLARISRAENCGVSLREIWEWTGVKLDCAVNFLKVPGSGDEDESGAVDAESVSVRHAEGETREGMRALGEGSKGPSPFMGQDEAGVQRQGEMEWCQPRLDIEAKVADGWLGMGVFALEDMIDRRGVGKLMRDVKESLGGVVGRD